MTADRSAGDGVPRILMAGDSVVRVEFNQHIDPVTNARVVATAAMLRQRPLPGVRDIVPTYCSVAVYFDPLRLAPTDVVTWLHAAATDAPLVPEPQRLPIRIPVRYGGSDGPDLAAVARHANLSVDDAVRLHAGRVYRVYMLGFLPGFAYMGTVDPRIAAPRRPFPRPVVPPGSVGIAGGQTGVYPSEAPGGWQVIGRTTVVLFDPVREPPCLFSPGDLVQFEPVSNVP